MSVRNLFTLMVFGFIVSTMGCLNDKDVDPDAIIKLTFQDTVEMKADGKRKFTATAVIPKKATDGFKTVTFRTATGKFEGSGKETEEKRVDANGSAKVVVIAGTEPGKDWAVSASIGADANKYVATEYFRLLPVGTQDMIKIDLATDGQIRADGASIITVKSSVFSTPLNVVTVTTNEGAFIDGGKETASGQVDQQGMVSFRLRVGTKATRYFVTASVSDALKITEEIDVLPAHAQRMIVEVDALKVKEDEVVAVSAFLKREKGNVSIDVPVTFFAFQLDGAQEKSVGRFTGTSKGTDADGKVVAQFHADSGSIDPAKPITIRITTPKDDPGANPLKEEIQLTFVVEEEEGD